jgi:hypothetical protein
MKVTKITCQGCGADLPVGEGDSVIRCEYCGASNSLDQPKGDKQVKEVRLVIKPGKGAKKAAKMGSRIALVTTLLTVGLVGGIAFFVNRTVSDTTSQVQKNVADAQDRAAMIHAEAQARIQKAQAESETRRLEAEANRALSGGAPRPPTPPRSGSDGGLRLQSDVPLVADVNGDGVPDAVVRARAGSEAVIVALSGKDLKPLWQTPSRADQIRLAGDRLLAIQRNEVTAHALADGKQQWKRSASDRIIDAERRGSTIVIESADDQLVSLAAADGATLPGKPATLDLIGEHDGQRGFGNLGLTHRSLGKAGKQLRPDRWFCPAGETQAGKTVRRQQGPISMTTTTYGCKADVAVAYAVRSRGTRVPFLVGVHRRKGALWERGLAPEGELTTLERAPWLAIQGDRVAAAFALRGKAADVLLLGLTDGKIAWRKPIGTGARGRISGVAMLGDRIFVNLDGQLVGLDAREGTPIQ